jgi:hypothetical protein
MQQDPAQIKISSKNIYPTKKVVYLEEKYLPVS